MKMTFLLSLILGTFILSGCVSSLKNEIEELKVVGGHIPDVPKIRKVPLKHYKNMSFEEFAKNIYAKPLHKYATIYIISCKTISDENNLTGANYLCQSMHIGNKFVWRSSYWQNKINEKLRERYLTIENELDKYCIANGGFILNNYKVHNNIMKICKLNNNNILFGYVKIFKHHFDAIKIYTKDYFNSFNNYGKLKRIEKFLLEHGAVKIGKNEFDVSNALKNGQIACDGLGMDDCGTDVYHLLEHFYPNLNAEYLYKLFDYYKIDDPIIKKQIALLFTKGKYINEYSDFVIYIDKNVVIAVLVPGIKHLFLINSITNFKVKQIISSAKKIRKQKEEQKEDINY